MTVNSTWDGSTDDWSKTAAWDVLGGSDPYPDNNASYEYDGALPANGGTPYTVGVDVGPIDLLSLDTDADGTLVLMSSDFDPGALTNDGVIDAWQSFAYPYGMTTSCP